MVAGNLYFYIHTTDFPAGEIRGQLLLVNYETDEDGVRTISLAELLNETQEPDPTSDSDATGFGTVDIPVAADGTVTYSSSLDVSGLVESDLLTPMPGVVGQDVIDNTIEVDTLISIEDVILAPQEQDIEGAIAGAPFVFDGQTFNDLDDGD